jgi:hypothetical protein
LGIVAAVAVVVAGIVVWQSVSSSGAGTGHAGGNRTLTRASRDSTGGKTQSAPLRGPAAEPWHRGLQPWGNPAGRPLPDFYYQWLRSRSSCAQVAVYGCWKLKVVTRHGCPHGLSMLIDETKGDADVGATWGFSRRLAAEKSTVVEVDADQNGVSGRLESMLCKS